MRITPILTLAATALCVLITSACASNNRPFGLWLEGVKREAAAQGIRPEVVDAALMDAQPIPRIIALDRKQPESTLTLEEYLRKVLPRARIEKARRLYRENLPLLREVSAKYNVQPQYIVALWGVESSFGESMGSFETVHALATLAYDGRRSDYFRKELLNALTILNEGHIRVEDMQGSWAGAMGQCQFMPTSFLRYAVDGNGDGKKDIWSTRPDVFASIANYLHSEGWDGSKGWGSKKHPRDNFNVLLKWNRSRYFATAVSQLADAIIKEHSK